MYVRKYFTLTRPTASMKMHEFSDAKINKTAEDVRASLKKDLLESREQYIRYGMVLWFMHSAGSQSTCLAKAYCIYHYNRALPDPL